MKETFKQKISMVQALLLISLVVATVFSNIITGRQLSIFGITMTGGTFIFPLVYVASDIFQEVYGYRWSRISAYIGFGFNALLAIISMIFVNMPAPSHYEGASIWAFQEVLGNTPRFLFASLAAYFLGDLVNDRIFARMKAKNKDSHDGFGKRAIASSVGGQFIAGLPFNLIGYIGAMPMVDLIISIPAGIVFSLLVEIMLLPLTKRLVIKTSTYEKESAHETKTMNYVES